MNGYTIRVTEWLDDVDECYDTQSHMRAMNGYTAGGTVNGN